jgi:hypothetical protein
MELMLMLCLLALTSLLSCALVLVLLSSVAGRLARRLTRNGSHALRWERRVKLGTLVLLLCVIGVMAYRAINPGDARYLEEFSEVSLRPAPASAHVVERSPTYGDWHGDSCSYSRIAMSNADYTRLLTELEADKRLRAGTDIASEGVRGLNRKSFTRQMPASAEQRLSLQFLGDGHNVEVNICAT